MKRGTLRGLLLASLIRAFSLAGCSDGGRTDDGRTVYAFAERDTIALSELFGSRGVRRVRLQAPDSVPAAAEGSILRLAGGRPVVCEPFGADRASGSSAKTAATSAPWDGSGAVRESMSFR